MPFVYLLIGVGAARVRAFAGKGRRALDLTLFFLCATVLLAFFQRGKHWTIYKPNPDWRTACQVLVDAFPTNQATLQVYSDYVAPTPLTYYDERIQESKNFEFNSAKWARAEDKLGQFPLLGPPLSGRIQGLRRSWEAQVERTRQQTRALVHELRFVDPNINQAQKGNAWLLLFGQPSQKAEGLLKHPKIRVGQAVHVRSLTLYPLAW